MYSQGCCSKTSSTSAAAVQSAASLGCKVKSWFPESADTGSEPGTLSVPGGSGFLRWLETSVPPEPEPRSHGYFVSCKSKQENPPLHRRLPAALRLRLL